MIMLRTPTLTPLYGFDRAQDGRSSGPNPRLTQGQGVNHLPSPHLAGQPRVGPTGPHARSSCDLAQAFQHTYECVDSGGFMCPPYTSDVVMANAQIPAVQHSGSSTLGGIVRTGLLHPHASPHVGSGGNPLDIRASYQGATHTNTTTA